MDEQNVSKDLLPLNFSIFVGFNKTSGSVNCVANSETYRTKRIDGHSEYIATTDLESCIHCGECVERCIFDARILNNEKMEYNPQACLGCGLCVTVCPVEATTMTLRKSESRKEQIKD